MPNELTPELKDQFNSTIKNVQSFIDSQKVQPTVDADALVGGTQRAQLPTPKQPTQPTDFVQRLQPSIKSSSDGLVRAQTEEAKKRDSVLNQILDRDVESSRSVFERSFEDNIRKITGDSSTDFLSQLSDANTKLALLEGNFRTRASNISNAEGQSQVFEGAQLSANERQRAVEVGNQALLVQALQGNFYTARQIAMDTTNFAVEDRQAELENLLSQYDALDGIVSGQEKQLLDAAKAEAEAEQASLERMQAAVDTAILSGEATVQEMQAFSDQSLSVDERTALAQQVIARQSTTDRELDLRERRTDIENQVSIIRDRNSSGGGSTEFGGGDQSFDDPFLNILAGTEGGRDLTQSEAEPFSKGFLILDQLGELSNTISTESTGPILGILRGNNPYDEKAQLINAQLKAMVPNLARGVYGEVGVLTDTDIRNYEQTLPNLRSTEDVSRAVLGMTLRVVQRSMESQLRVMAASGRDVSGFVPLYQDITDQVDAIESSLQGPDNSTDRGTAESEADQLGLSTEPTSVFSKISNFFGKLF